MQNLAVCIPYTTIHAPSIPSKKIVCFNFEDDTTLPVIELQPELMDILEKWYKKCNILVEVEIDETCVLPTDIDINYISNLLFKEIDYKHKDDFINKYLPLVYKQYRTAQCIEIYNNTFQKKSVSPINTSANIRANPSTNINTKLKSPFDHYLILMEETELQLETPNAHKIVNPFIGVDTPLKQQNEYKLNELLKDVTIPPNLIGDFNKKNKLFLKNISMVQHKYDDTTYDGDGIIPYNSDYNVLYPHFSDTCEIFDGVSTSTSTYLASFDKCDETKEENIYTLCLMFNVKYNILMVVKNPNADELNIIKNYEQYGFLNVLNIETNNEDIMTFIMNNFDAQECLLVELNSKLKVLSEHIYYVSKYLENKNKELNEEQKIKKHMQYFFNVDEDINNRMKASVLFDNVIKAKIINIDNEAAFKVRFAKYLTNMGLKKKRYNDGIYYYGIKTKF